jgi:hypothetical protein
MKVWTFGGDCNKDVNIRTALDYFQKHFIAVSMTDAWEPPDIRIQGKSKRLRDFVCWMMSVPVLSKKAVEVLEPLIGQHCEILPLIELRGKPFYALNVLTTVDCLDKAGSDILYSPNDPVRILSIGPYKFDEKKIPDDIPIFKLPEYTATVFVTRAFIDAVIDNGLCGASFHDPAANPFGKLARGEPLNVIPGLPE